MKNRISKAARIRDRNQLTIPRLIAQSLPWVREDVFVNIEANRKEIIIKPVVKEVKRKKKLTEKEWSGIYKKLEVVRKSGKQDVDLGVFIQKDRLSH